MDNYNLGMLEALNTYIKSKKKSKDNLYDKAKKVYDSMNNDDKILMMGKLSSFKNSSYIYYRKIYKINNRIAGFVDLYKFPEDKDKVVLVYAISPKFRGKGLANKLIQDTIEFVRNDKNINSIIWRTDKRNDASNYLAKKFNGYLIAVDEIHNIYQIDVYNY
jgi:RimJ/RimL family protein N-acetyltransferase